MNLDTALKAETAIRKIFYGICERGVNAIRVAPEGSDQFHIEVTSWKPLAFAVKAEIRDAFKAGAGRETGKGDIVVISVKPLKVRHGREYESYAI